MVTGPPPTLDELDAERPDRPFRVRVNGHTTRLRAPTAAGWRDLVAALGDWRVFVSRFGPANPHDRALVERLPVWKMTHLVQAWRAHHGLCAHDRDHGRLLALLGKAAYRSAIERDLREVYGLDLTEEFQQRRWRRLLNAIDGLRRTSHLHEAMAQDDQLAEEILRRQRAGEADRHPTRRMNEFGLEAELLSHIVDRVGELIQTVGAANGARRRRVAPMPRPETALHRAKQRRACRQHRFTVGRVFGYLDASGNPTGKAPHDPPPA